jgi:hypothetical protein
VHPRPKSINIFLLAGTSTQVFVKKIEQIDQRFHQLTTTNIFLSCNAS